MNEPVAIEQWPDRLAAFVAGLQTPGLAPAISRVIVVRETDSTQDAARRLNAESGCAIVAWRQTAGRGRLGRGWADTGELGVALTLVTDRGRPERLAIVGAIAAALAAEQFLKRPVKIKWPNDIYVDGRKLAGVLIEQIDSKALVGIGLNVGQQEWPGELASRAVSMAQLREDVDRIEVIESLLWTFCLAIEMADSQLCAEFTKRDCLSGTRASFRVGGVITAGHIIEIDPMRGLRVRSEDGESWLEAATASIVSQDATLS